LCFLPGSIVAPSFGVLDLGLPLALVLPLTCLLLVDTVLAIASHTRHASKPEAEGSALSTPRDRYARAGTDCRVFLQRQNNPENVQPQETRGARVE
jgi:hypothetical protein